MGVDGGSGNPISLLDIQTYYGGSNPIGINEYYRGGSEVPATRTDTTTNTGITALNNSGYFGTRGSSVSGNQTQLTLNGPDLSNTGVGTGTITFSASTTVSVTKTYGFDTGLLLSGAHLRLGSYDFLDGANAVSGSTSSSTYATLFTLTSDQVDGTCGIATAYNAGDPDKSGTLTDAVRIRRGGTVLYSFSITYDNGTGGGANTSLTGLQNGDIVEAKHDRSGSTSATFYPREALGGNAANTFSAGSYSLSVCHQGGNNDNAGWDGYLSFSTSGTVQYTSFGGAFTSVSTTDTDVTVNTNTNVPASGTIDMDVFNDPGTASP